ncbi:polysaccharide lyase family 8 super-sandwich domain-containing protein [Chitinophaga sp. GbtcB8]|uniref:polysaccharide lyase family 8 super-sandwich domain-containing protein n=1 Tax=Chitinophaga sp. GbtcB8 TaxID=2824753 RepID=UPI001C2F590A|nr:polysaccharide lyase family 8 super-sandwich domain-containing protein [Chitinophaga sp. GbtcB8]
MLIPVRIAAVCLLLAGLQLKTHAQTDYTTIMANVTAEARRGVNINTLNTTVTNLMNMLNANGTWSDITYNGDVPYNTHVSRIRTMALAYSHSSSTHYNSAALLNKIVLALRYWNQTLFDSANWWYDQIGNPKPLGQALILMRGGSPGLPQTVEDSAINYMVLRGGTPSSQTGANRVDIAMHWIYRGALTASATVVNTGVTQAFSTLALVSSGSEGINYDYAFLQHGPELQTQTYGTVFIQGIYNVGLYIVGTSYSMTTAQKNIAFIFLHNSFYAPGRKFYSDFSLMGRSISRSGSNKGIGYTLASMAIKVDPAHAAILRDDSLRAAGAQPPGYNLAYPYHMHYWTGDYTLHNRPAYTFSVRGVSSRTYRTESINGENLLGKFLADGATDIRVNGNEYYNIFPVWDWNKVPGVTMREFATPQQNSSHVYGSTAFTGGVSDSTYGASAYQQNYVGVTAKKAWFFFDKEVVCLGAGINSTAAENITTCVNQCLLNGAVTVSSGGAVSTLAPSSQVNYSGNLQWMLHDSIGYFFPSGGNITVSNRLQSGNWYTINQTMANATVTDSVFKASISHGVAPSNGKYAYVVAPGLLSVNDMQAYNLSAIKITANADTIQAVRHRGLKMIQAIFYKAGTLTDSAWSVTVDKPCAVLLKNIDSAVVSLSIADPSQQANAVLVSLTTPGIGSNKQLLCGLPQGNYSGSSARFAFNSNTHLTSPDSLLPVADAYVRDGSYAGTNYGTATSLVVKNDAVDYARQSYLRFDLRSVTRPVSNAKLRLYGSGNTQTNTVQWALYKVNNNTWQETGITWNNKPAGDTLLATIQGQSAKGYSEWDITQAVNRLPADSLLSLQITGTISNPKGDATFNARESGTVARRPCIVLDNNSLRTTAPVAAVTPVAQEKPIGIKIYPNPVVNSCTIKTDRPMREIMVFDVNGKTVKTISGINTLQYQLKLGDVEKGIYFISIKGKDFRVTKVVSHPS